MTFRSVFCRKLKAIIDNLEGSVISSDQKEISQGSRTEEELKEEIIDIVKRDMRCRESSELQYKTGFLNTYTISYSHDVYFLCLLNFCRCVAFPVRVFVGK